MVLKIIQIYRFTKILKNFIIHLILLYIYLFEISSTRTILLSIALVNTILRNLFSSFIKNKYLTKGTRLFPSSFQKNSISPRIG